MLLFQLGAVPKVRNPFRRVIRAPRDARSRTPLRGFQDQAPPELEYRVTLSTETYVGRRLMDNVSAYRQLD